MMDIDLTELLRDPEFVNTFAVIRREQVEDGDDYAELESRHETAGSIQPATARELERLPEEDRDRETISIFTEFPLRHGGRGMARPDRILWGGASYLVVGIEPWHHLGATFVKALAQRELA